MSRDKDGIVYMIPNITLVFLDHVLQGSHGHYWNAEGRAVRTRSISVDLVSQPHGLSDTSNAGR